MGRTIKSVAVAAATCFTIGIIVWIFSQDLNAKASSTSPGPSALPASSTAAAKYVNPPRVVERWQYGRIKSLTRRGGRFEMRFDPAFWLSGVTARRAALEDHPNDPGGDYYVLDEGHRLVTYLVPAKARVTIVTRLPASEASTVSELAQLIKGKNPKKRRWLNMQFGFWIRISGDTVRSLHQQYRP